MREIPKRSQDPGVPEALPRVLIRLRDRLGVDAVDRLWIFPPARRGRQERGLVAVSTFLEGSERRSLVTVSYAAEQTGRGVSVEPLYTREGEAPPDRLPGIMQGVVQRIGDPKGAEAREVEIGGSGERFEGLLEEFDEQLLEGVSIDD